MTGMTSTLPHKIPYLELAGRVFFVKTKGKREEAESPWLGTMCGIAEGGALAFLTAVAILFLCALAVSNRWLGQG